MMAQLEAECRQAGLETVCTKKAQEENEHSLEMHLPFLAHLASRGVKVQLVPLMIGQTDPAYEQALGQLLSRHLDREDSLFVISSDFCHWGANFEFYYQVPNTPISRGIEELDREGMGIIEKQDPLAFQSYLAAKENTICGRHPIAILLHVPLQSLTLGHPTLRPPPPHPVRQVCLVLLRPRQKRLLRLLCLRSHLFMMPYRGNTSILVFLQETSLADVLGGRVGSAVVGFELDLGLEVVEALVSVGPIGEHHLVNVLHGQNGVEHSQEHCDQGHDVEGLGDDVFEQEVGGLGIEKGKLRCR